MPNPISIIAATFRTSTRRSAETHSKQHTVEGIKMPMLSYSDKWYMDRNRLQRWKQPSELACSHQRTAQDWQGQRYLGSWWSQRDVTLHLLCTPAASAPPLFPEEAGTSNCESAHIPANLLSHYIPRSALTMSNAVLKSDTGYSVHSKPVSSLKGKVKPLLGDICDGTKNCLL